MITKLTPVACSVFTSKKNGKKYAKVWYPVPNAYVVGTPVESFITPVADIATAESIMQQEHMVAVQNGQIVTVDFNVE